MSDDLKREIIQTMLRMRKLHGAHGGGFVGRDDNDDKCGKRGMHALLDKHGMHEMRGMHGRHDMHGKHGMHGMNINSIIILSIIEQESAKHEHPDFSTIIHQYAHISKAAVSMQLKALEQKGLIERTLNHDDMRRFDFRLTASGHELTKKLRSRIDARLEWMIEKMGEADVRELLRLFNKMADVLSEADCGGAEAEVNSASSSDVSESGDA
jgi:DNA-binding MarR family transcriptional regulator